ncbi:hypothetical protein KGQ25_01205, partial [Patescibacteria group bacterium]|nr:hypothetical protein [Patescibacteria group bacterium]
MYSCQDTRTTAGTSYSGKVVDENGNPLSGVTVSLYVGGPVNLQVDTQTDASGNWSFQMAGNTSSIYHFAWFHNKQGYDSTGRIALTAGGSQGTYVMKTLQPLSIFPSTVNLPRQGMARVSLTLNNFDNENDITDADLQICAVQNATSCANFVDYQTYLNNGYLNRTDPFPFVYLNNRSNTVTFVYDNVNYPNLSSINNVFYALRRKSNPSNITTGLLKLYGGTYIWTLSATNNTARDKTSVWALPTCSSVGASVGSSCSVLNVGSTCAIDDSATSWRQLNCELAGNTAQPVTMVPSYSQMSMTTKLPVQIAVNGISNPTTNTKVCSEVLAQPNVPSAVDAGKCSDLANFYSFSGNSDWTPTLNGWIGNIKYDPSIYGAVGIQVKSYFMNAATGGYAGSTIEVVGGTAAASPTQTNPSSTTAQIQWNSGGSGGTYITNIDPTSIQTLSWHST